MDKLIYSFLFVCCILLLVGCDSGFSRSDAEKYLKTQSKEYTQTLNFRQGPQISVHESHLEKETAYYEKSLKDIAGVGLITYEKHLNKLKDGRYQLWFEVKPTKKLEPYIFKRYKRSAEIVLAKRVFDEVTIFRNEKDYATCRWTSKVVVTPVGKVIPPAQYLLVSSNHDTTFIRHKDGWRPNESSFGIFN